MKYNPKIHHRRSIRLKGYDYSQSGLYFITICCQHHASLFGYIDDGKMVMNDAGKMVEHWYYELQNKFKNIQCHEMVVMPNHFHCIIEIVNDVEERRGRPMCLPNDIMGEHTGSPVHGGLGEHTGSPVRVSISSIVQWFKTMTTNNYIRGVRQNGWQPFEGRLWLRNYWERIIRDEKEYEYIANYIINNPIQWESDILKNG